MNPSDPVVPQSPEVDPIDGSQVPNPTLEELDPSWSLRLFMPLVKLLMRLVLLRYRAPIRTRSPRNVPKSGGLLIFANHLSNTDPVLVQVACPRHIHFLARRELFAMDNIKKFIRWWRAVPITQSSSDTAALKTAIGLLQKGRVVCIFPEGQLSPDGELLPLLPGAALLTRKSGVSCICVGLKNTNRLMPSPEVTPRRADATLTAVWGEPKTFPPKSSAEDIMAWVESELRRLPSDETHT